MENIKSLTDTELMSKLLDSGLTKEQQIYVIEIANRWSLDNDKKDILLSGLIRGGRDDN